MKKFIIALLCLLTLGIAAGLSTDAQAQRHRPRTVKGSGKMVTEKYNTRRFDAIRSGNGIDVEVSHGPFSVRATTDRNALKYLEIEVDDGTLRIRYENNINVRNIRTTVYVSMPELESLKVSGGSDIELLDRFEGKSLEVDASSAGSIKGSVYYDYIEADASSGGDIRLSGKARKCEAEVSSGASINFLDLRSERVDAEASSGGVARVCATESLTGKASSGGVISYTGDPKNMDVRSSSGGSLRKIESRH